MPSTAPPSPSTRIGSRANSALRNDTGGPFRIRVTALDGRELVLDGSVSPVVDGAVIVFRDVTDEHLRKEPNEHSDTSQERRLQQQLVQSGKLAAIGELAAGVAHEINNPLFAILGLTEFLLKEAEPGSKAHQRLELIQQTGLEIKEIVRALLDFARENADERHEVALDDVVRSTVDLVRRTNAHKDVELVDTYEDAGALVLCEPEPAQADLPEPDRERAAGDAERRHGHGRCSHRARIRGRNGQRRRSRDRARRAQPHLRAVLHDQAHTGGTGLGLSVSIGIAEAHGGTLTAYSELGHGAQFTLRLPLCDEELER